MLGIGDFALNTTALRNYYSIKLFGKSVRRGHAPLKRNGISRGLKLWTDQIVNDMFFLLIRRGGEAERAEGREERWGKERKKGREDKEERKGWKTAGHISRILKSSILHPLPSSHHPLFVSISLSPSLSLGWRRLIFGIPPTRLHPALLGMVNDRRYVSALRIMNLLTPIKTSEKRRSRLPPRFI